MSSDLTKVMSVAVRPSAQSKRMKVIAENIAMLPLRLHARGDSYNAKVSRSRTSLMRTGSIKLSLRRERENSDFVRKFDPHTLP
jgi:flagellar basal body rod protein FlgC